MSNYIYSKRDQIPWGGIYSTDNSTTTITTNTQLSVSSGQYLPTFYYQNLTINAGVTLTTSNPCKGLILIVKGTLTLNGVISMTARGFGSASLPTPDTVDLYTLVNSRMLRLGIYEATQSPTDRPNNATFPIGQQVSPITPKGSNGSSGQNTLSCGGGGGSYNTGDYVA
jgi:hypothetical protein